MSPVFEMLENEIPNFVKECISKIKASGLQNPKEEKVFREIFPQCVPFVHWQESELMIQFISTVGRKIIKAFDLTSEISLLWGDEGIKTMFMKGLNPAASEYIFTTFDLIASDISSRKTQEITGLELGCGAGWSTLISWNRLSELGLKKITLYTVDNSPYAIASTLLLLENFGIPYKLVPEGTDLINGNSDFNGVVVSLCGFDDILDRLKGKELDFAYSNHGTAYLSQREHKKIIEKLSVLLRKGSPFVTDSLNPEIKFRLDRMSVFLRVLRGGNVKSEPGKGFVITIEGEIRYVTQLLRVAERRFMDWLHYLMFNDFNGFRWYIKALARSEKSQQELYLSVGVPSSSLKDSENLVKGLTLEKVNEQALKALPPFVETALLRKH